jgi:DNA polymerase-3 subunit delta'
MARRPAAVTETEDIPEADRLEPYPHPRDTRVLYGHEAAEGALAQAFAGGRMHHGWLLSGPEGIGKATLAYRLAMHVFAAPDERDPFGRTLAVGEETHAARQVRALSHPGLLVLRRPYDFKAKRLVQAIPVDEVRRVKSFLGHRAGEGAWRVVIVDAADDLNLNAANALLKSLEEPPPRTLFLLVVSQPAGLLPTIRSRCRGLALAPLEPAALRKAVAAAREAAGEGELSEAELAPLSRLARGSVRRVLSLASGGGLDLHTRITGLTAALPKLDWGGVHALADELSSAAAEQRFELFFELLLDHLSRLVRAGAGAPADADLAAAADRLGVSRALATWAELWETVVREKADTLALNLDRKTLILDTFARLETATRR